MGLGLLCLCAHADEYAEVSQLARAGKSPEALQRADQFLASQPKDAQMRFIKGVLQRDTGKPADAIATFTKLTEDYPDLPEPYNNLAVLYANQGQLDKARVALEMAIRTNPSYSIAHENLGDVYAKLASQAYNKALQLDDNNSAIVPKLALIRELFSTTPNKAARAGTSTTSTATASSAGSTAPSSATPSTPSTTPSAKTPTTPSTTPTTSGNPTNTAPTTTAGTATKPPTPATSPTTTTTNAAAANTADVQTVVKKWAQAWENKDVKTYLSYYGKDFEPPNKMRRNVWEEERRSRITGKSSISVKIDNLAVTITNARATAKFRQDYKANGLAVSSKKVLELQKYGDQWRIVKEYVGN